VIICGLRDSLVKIDKEGVNRYLNIKDINKIKFHRGSGFWTGALVGSAISFTFWAFIAFSAHDKEASGWAVMFGLISIVPAGIVGGIIGIAANPANDMYDFSSGNPKAKLKRLRYIIDKHTPLIPPQPE
jgi:hypothetical protein